MAVTMEPALSKAQAYRCSNCGSVLEIPKNSKGHVTCNYCDTPNVIQGLVKNAEMSAKENINSGISLQATAAELHELIISSICTSRDIPLDIFDKAEIVREERYCVPAYCFYCNGNSSFQYEIGVERQQQVIVQTSKGPATRTKTVIEYNPQSSNVSASATLFSPGNRELAPQLVQLYFQLDPGKLEDYEYLEFPHDVITYDYNFPQAASFNEYVKPHIEMLLKNSAENTLKSKNVRNLSMGGSSIQKDEVVRVFLGLYCVVYKYDEKEYRVWATGDALKYLYDLPPVDPQRQTIRAEQQQALKAVPKKGVGGFIGLIIACVIAALIGFANGGGGIAVGIIGILLVGLFIWLIIMTSNKNKIYDAQRAAIQRDIDSFESQLTGIINNFKSQGRKLNGIYQNGE